jgi:hypothetical protein
MTVIAAAKIGDHHVFIIANSCPLKPIAGDAL